MRIKKLLSFYFLFIIIYVPITDDELVDNYIILKINSPYNTNYPILSNKFNFLPSEIYLNGNKTIIDKNIFINSNGEENIIKMVFNKSITN